MLRRDDPKDYNRRATLAWLRDQGQSRSAGGGGEPGGSAGNNGVSDRPNEQLVIREQRAGDGGGSGQLLRLASWLWTNDPD